VNNEEFDALLDRRSILFYRQNELYLSVQEHRVRWQNMAHASFLISENSVTILMTLISRSPMIWRKMRWRLCFPSRARPRDPALRQPVQPASLQGASITSHEHSRLAKLADFNLSWHVPQTRIAGVYDITTQIPVIYILESLGRKLAKKLAE
jgi:hypothetical protein